MWHYVLYVLYTLNVLYVAYVMMNPFIMQLYIEADLICQDCLEAYSFPYKTICRLVTAVQVLKVQSTHLVQIPDPYPLSLLYVRNIL